MQEKFEINTIELNKLEKCIRSFYRTKYIGSPIFLILNYIFCYSFIEKIDVTFFVLFITLSIASTIYCFCIPLKAIKQYKSVVKTMVLDDKLIVTATLVSGITITLNDYEIKDFDFKIDNTVQKSKKIINIQGNDCYIILAFFDEGTDFRII